MSRVAAIDCGTNAIRLLVVDRSCAGLVQEVVRRTEIVRLGEDVDRTRRFTAGALARTRARAEEYAAQCAGLGVTRVRFAATSAARDVLDAGPLEQVVRDTLSRWGTTLEILTGEQEAAATFAGAVGAVRDAGHDGPFLVVDVGGGSTELARGDTRVERSRSVDIGAVRLHERLRPADPPTPDDLARARAAVDVALDPALDHVGLDDVHTLVGVAGTAATVAAHALRRSGAPVGGVHLAAASPGAVVDAALDLASMTVADRAALDDVTPGREDVVGPGALVWARVVERAAAAGVGTVVVSEHDLLDTLAEPLPGAEEASDARGLP